MSWDRSKGRPEPIRALNRVREIECGEPLVDLRIVAPEIKLPRTTVIPFCRARVAHMVRKAALSLPSGYFLAVTDAWRSLYRQRMIHEWMAQCARELWPDISYAALRRKVNRWVAPYDEKAPPGHCTGAALDVNLVDDKGETIDVWSPFSRVHARPTFSYGLTKDAHRNRMILYEAMMNAGFSNCRDEWWHYSFGDAGWAVRMGFDECFYGIIEPVGFDFAALDEPWLKSLRERPNPFITKTP